MSHAPHHHAATVDILPAGASDSHGAGHHGHTIVPMRLLVTVLATLMFFTVLTVLAANAEEFFAQVFHVHIAAWVNVAVALSIGAVKSIIVALYFMQLRYDTPVNALVGVFTIMILTFFLGFTMIDLGNRDALDEYKAHQVVYGGYGDVEVTRVEKDPSTGALIRVKKTIPNGTSVAAFVRLEADLSIEQSLNDGTPIESHAYLTRLFIHHNELQAMDKLTPVQVELYKKMHAYIVANEHEFEHIAHELEAHGGAHPERADAPPEHKESSSNASRVRTGLTPHLFDDAPAAPAHGETPAPHGH